MHLIVNCNEPFILKNVIRDFKRHTSSACFNWILKNSEGRKDWMVPLFETAGQNDPKIRRLKFDKQVITQLIYIVKTLFGQKLNTFTTNLLKLIL